MGLICRCLRKQEQWKIVYFGFVVVILLEFIFIVSRETRLVFVNRIMRICLFDYLEWRFDS